MVSFLTQTNGATATAIFVYVFRDEQIIFISCSPNKDHKMKLLVEMYQASSFHLGTNLMLVTLLTLLKILWMMVHSAKSMVSANS